MTNDTHFPFVGRKPELASLERLLAKKTANLVVIKGRRRIGKSRLIDEFAKNKKYYSFTALSPLPETTLEAQLNEFARQLASKLGLPGLRAHDWGDLFDLLAKSTQNGRVIILLDEISWMGSKDPNFLGKLKIAWDSQFSKNPELILVLCGSVSVWIEENILSSTDFFGRVAYKPVLNELSLAESSLLIDKLSMRWSNLEKLMALAITGGIPWYITLLNPKLTALENIKELCFTRDGILVSEFKYIFHDLFENQNKTPIPESENNTIPYFGKRGEIYKKIIECLSKKPSEYEEIAEAIEYPSGGPLSEYLNDLQSAGFICREYTWNLKTTEESKLSKFRLKDNYLYFYLKYIGPNLKKIQINHYQDISLSTLPAWDSILGLQFEKLILNNRDLILKRIGIRREDVVCDNPYFQKSTSVQKGCQIVYLIQTRYKTLFACEIKYSTKIINHTVVHEVQQKMNNLALPKGFALCPVLIYAGELHDSVRESGYFSHIINIEDELSE